ncbi:type I-F CRISPR-associated endoribonuclease Cas6/Csy4 [Marinicella gelatinilytica]|uniref:type I-F CRISPR-associated endoribonuclease Cas6/Csy4 n=1 Tax=Marinicella gelatinilytica TaxID=2996017 RepID=UPI0022608B1E|nr:type I-F CRISPR-associated endoribonuclease Cas6/Csy4 [Marinicella gelatinilytica]MCX7546288.1 type I-F CRISPR-associated endoribonuclease Cas6/Csy4 [Marinicella gelatinilytica]
MNHYQEITIIKSPDISPYFVWSKVFMQVHIALVELKNKDDTVNIGVSFPEYRRFEKNDKIISVLGSKLRVFAKSEDELRELDLNQWLSRLSDYVHIKSIKSVPEKDVKNHLVVNKVDQIGNMERLTRRFAKRKNISFEAAKQQQIENYAKEKGISISKSADLYDNPKLQSYPYIMMKSLSGNNQFSLEIDQSETDQPQTGVFNTYGMSSKTTVPHW